MSGCLLDTNVISEVRKGTVRAHPNLWKWWLSMKEESLFLSALTLGEIRKGIDRLASRDSKQALAPDARLRGLKTGFSDHILAVSPSIAETGGRLQAIRSLPEIDAMLAATALDHDLTLVTRNVHDFSGLGVRLFNPFEASD